MLLPHLLVPILHSSIMNFSLDCFVGGQVLATMIWQCELRTSRHDEGGFVQT